MYAVKEVAKYRDDKDIRDKITIEIIILSLLLCIIGYIAVWLLARFVPQIHEQSSLFFILSLSIVFNSIGVNWFYQGIEEFKFITIRAIIIRALSATALFMFVKSPSDILIYGLVTVGSTVGNNLVNFLYLRKFIHFDFHQLKYLNTFKHLYPALQVFILNLIISLYMQINSVMLGFISGENAVGYYTAGTRISHIGLTIITSLGTVLLPRCSHLIKLGDKIKFNEIINKSLNLTLALTLPVSVGLILLSKPVTLIFCGNDYYDAIPVLWFSAPLIVFASLSNLLAIQILYPLDKIKIVIICVSMGALMNIVFNILLIPHLEATGAAVASLIAEIAVLTTVCIFGKNYFPFKLLKLINLKYTISTIIMALMIIIVQMYLYQYITQIIICTCTGIFIYGILLYLLKDTLFMEMLNIIRKYLKKCKVIQS